MSMISFPKGNKAESNQLGKLSVSAAEPVSAEGSLLEEFSQILDKIADQLARGHKDAETIDLLAVEQAAERVQAQVTPQVQRSVESGVPEKIECSVETDDRDEEASSAYSSDSPGMKVVDEDAEQPQTMMTQHGTNEDGSDLQSFEEEVVQAKGEKSSDTVSVEDTDQMSDSELETVAVSDGSVDDGSAPEPKSELVTVDVKVEGDVPVDTSADARTLQHAAPGRTGSSESGRTGADVVTGMEQIPQRAPSASEIRGVSEMSMNEVPRTVGNLTSNLEVRSGGMNGASGGSEKAVPFTTFMLQGNGFTGSGLSRDTVAQAILRPALESSLGRQVGDVAASGKGGAQSGMGGFNGDASMLRGASREATSENSARALKALPRAVVARTLEKVERALEEVARSKDGKTISLHLEPVSLGKVKVDVSLRDGNLHARLSAEAGEVQQLLREHAHELQAILRKVGLHVDSVSVSVGSENGTFESTADLFGRESFSGRSERDGETGGFVAPPQVEDNGRTTVVDDHWVA